MKSNKIQPQFTKKYNPRVGLIALATDFIIEKDFIKIIKNPISENARTKR